MSDEEAAQVLGASFPIQPDSRKKDAQAEQLNSAFGNLVFSLCDKRIDLLEREHDSQKLQGIFEFPRKLGKFQSVIVKFLAEVFTPSELHASPFLRGFYFSGFRTIVINEVAPPRGEHVPQPLPGNDPDASRVFRAPGKAQPIPQPRVIEPRKILQWTFLHRFFNEVLLQDSAAMGASNSSVRTNNLRKVVFASMTAICLLFALIFTISWLGNRALENEVFDSARTLSTVNSTLTDAQFTNAVSSLDSLRQTIRRLSEYETGKRPLRLRFGLYAGHELYPRAREIYFNSFRHLLFGETQVSLVEYLKRLPLTPSTNDDYGATYDALKGYLITTSDHDKSTQAFLSPLLFNRWASTRKADPHTSDLARTQFDFYSEELKVANPFFSENDSLAVERARRYLSMFADTGKIYRSMLADAEKKNPSISFNRDFPGSSEVVLNNREVSGAYSKAGWSFMQIAIKDPPRYFSGEKWVLGDQTATGGDRVILERELAAKYTSDFIAQWQEFAHSGSIKGFSTYKDAARKLNAIASAQSPLLAMLCLVSRNTAVEDMAVKSAFQSVQAVVPVSCTDNKYNSEANTPYINGLIALGTDVEQIANSPATPGDALVTKAATSAGQAKTAARQLGFQAHLEAPVQKLLLDPITAVESLLRGAGTAQLNEKGASLCAQFASLQNTYPFNSSVATKASVKDLNSFFQPMGAFAAFRAANLTTGQNGQPVSNPNAGSTITPGFSKFASKAAAFSAAVYPGNSAQPNLAYTLRSYPIEGAEVTLSIDGETLKFSKQESKDFRWTGLPTEIKLTLGGLGIPPYTGLWSPFEFFGDTDSARQSGGKYTHQWKQRGGAAGRPMILPNGKELIVQFDLEGPGAPIFQKNYFADFKCVSEIAK